ncbi:MAG: four helix bundle protein [Pyrinomonadaceae bacterium]
MSEKIVRHQDLDVYKKAFEAAMQIFEISKGFPKEETYSLTDQIRRSSRSACANLAEAWRKRRYLAAFISKLSDAEGEAAEKQIGRDLYRAYDEIISMMVGIISNPDKWIIPVRRK